MKPIQNLFFLFLFVGIGNLFSQNATLPSTYITDTGDTITTSPSNQHLVAPPPNPLSCATTNQLATPYNQNNGQRGIMFDITALSNITIQCFDVNMDVGTSNVAIYYKVGTHVGFQTTPGAWTLIGTAPNVVGLGANQATYVPLPIGVTVTAGCTVAFYITRTTVNGPIIDYTNGTVVGTVFASNADLQIKDGTGKDYLFAASFSPRRFNGTVHYDLNSSSGGGVINGPLSMCTGSSQTYTFTGLGWTTYTWTVPVGTTITSGQGTNTITIIAGANPGNICVTPSNACGNGPTTCIAVTIAPSPTSTFTVTNVLCNGGNTGSAIITASPVGTYTYVWTPNVSTTNTASNLTAGTYTVTATNSGGCSTTQTITITQPPTLTNSVTATTNVLCNGGLGALSCCAAAGGTGPYTYSWTPAGGAGCTSVPIPAGTYTCTTTDAHGCITTTIGTITQPPAMSLAMSSTVAPCGSLTGTATVAQSGGVGPYTFSWSSGGTNATENNLGAGSYSVTVTDAHGCTSTATVVVPGGSSPTSSISSFTNVTCFGANDGTATVLAASGTSPYTYSWSSGGTGATENNLGGGTFTVTVTDANGCTVTSTVTIVEPPVLTASIASTNILCNGMNTGSATVTANGGSPVYSYAWSPSGGNAAAANNLSPQSYTCTVTDANGCNATASATITEPTLLTTTFSQVDELCANGNTGSATVIPAGGTPNYSYSWSPSGGNNATASNLTAGNYTSTITDANGCSINQSFTITQPAGLVASSGPNTNVACFGQSTGIINITQVGGNPGYTYAWLPNVSATNSVNNLPAATYQITVTDANGCTSTVTVTITQPPQLTVTATAAPNAVCSGSSVALTANPSGGTPAYNVTWMPGNLSGNSQNITPTISGTDSCFVIDANGCTATATVNVTVYPMPTAALAGDLLAGCAPICVNFSDNSTIANPGIITAWNWDFGDGNTSSLQNPSHCYTTSGVYTVILNVKSADGCTSTITMTNYISVFANPVAAFTAFPQPTTILTPTITFTDNSTNAFSWLWNFGDVLNSTSTSQNPTFTYSYATCYPALLTVTSADGCIDTVSHPVCFESDFVFYAPNAFTPNGDTHNDIFSVLGDGIDPNKFDMWVFDRWGNLIFHTNDLNKGWDGRANGGSSTAQADTYVWKVRAYDNSGNMHSLIGHVSLIR